MVFDIEEHEENRMRYLASLYAIAEGFDGGETAPTGVFERDSVIGERANLTTWQWERIATELEDEGLLDLMGGDASGRDLMLTSRGCKVVEKYLYEKSLLGKRRKLKAWAKSKAAEVAQIGAGKLLAWASSLGLMAFGISKAESIARALKHLLGH